MVKPRARFRELQEGMTMRSVLLVQTDVWRELTQTRPIGVFFAAAPLETAIGDEILRYPLVPTEPRY